jgi:serine/threonine-protein kinase
MRSLPLLSAIVIVAVLVPSEARADDRAIAEQAFQEGRALMAAGDLAQACPKFAAAAQLSQTAGVRLNLAECYAKLGKTASAWVKADEARAIAERAGDSAAAALAHDQMAALEPNLSYLTIIVAKTAASKGMQVTLDGEKTAWGMAYPIDPGEHEVRASAPGRKSWSTKATVTWTGGRSSVSVPALEAEDMVAAPAPLASQPSRPQGATDVATSGSGWSRSTAHTLAFVSGGAAIVALGIGTGLGVDAISKKSQYQQHQVNGRCSDEQCVTLSTEAVSAAAGSTVSFVLGAALVAAGAVLWFTAPGGDAEGRKVAIVPMAGPRNVGAGLTGSW